jgi:hypothetical protein
MFQSFPHLPEHAAVWAAEKLSSIFSEKPAARAKFIQVPYLKVGISVADPDPG